MGSNRDAASNSLPRNSKESLGAASLDSQLLNKGKRLTAAEKTQF